MEQTSGLPELTVDDQIDFICLSRNEYNALIESLEEQKLVLVNTSHFENCEISDNKEISFHSSINLLVMPKLSFRQRFRWLFTGKI